MIKIYGLEKTLSPNFTLKIGELTINDGERVALVGSNGSGKTTLLRLIAGVIKPDKGGIELSFPSGRVGYQPQQPYIFRGTARSNVKLGASGGNGDIEKILEKCLPPELWDKKTNRMSGGEKQKMCFARMLAGNYDCLLLDEPLSAVDIEAAAELERVLADSCEQNGSTLLISTHIPSEALRVSTKILFMNNGTVEEYTDAGKLQRPQSDFAKKFISLWSL